MGASGTALIGIVQFLVDARADVNATALRQASALHSFLLYCRVGSSRQRFQSIQYLIQADADIDATTIHNFTPLHFATNSRSLQFVELLVESGCRTDIRTRRGRTALETALLHNDSQIVDFLKSRSRENVVQAIMKTLDPAVFPVVLIELIADFVTLV